MAPSLRISGYGDPRTTELDAAAALDNGALAVISVLDWSDPNALWEKTGGGWVLVHHADREDLGDLSAGHLAEYAMGTVVKTGTGTYRKGADGWVSVVVHDLDEQPGPTVSGSEPAGAMYTDRRPDSAWWRLDEDTWIDAGVESPDTAAGVSFDASGLDHTEATDVQDALADLDTAISTEATARVDAVARLEALASDPMTALPWLSAAWANDPAAATPGDGNPVASWRAIGKGGPYVQGTAGQRPLYTNNVAALNRRASLTFDGVDDYLELTTSLAVATAFSLVVVCDRLGAGSGGTPGIVAPDSTGFAALLDKYPNGGDYGWFAGGEAVADGALDLNTGHLFVTYIDQGSGAFSITRDNGAPAVGSGAGAQDLAKIRLGQQGTAGNNANTAIAFVGAYSGDVTADPGWTAFLDWVAAYYALAIA